jgi:hypothetical protein
MHPAPRRVALGGAIIVTAALLAAGLLVAMRNLPLLPGLAGCGSLVSDQRRIDCVADRAAPLLADAGTLEGAAKLDRIASENGGIASVCHRSMHMVAASSYRSLRRDLEALLETDPAGECSSGLVHGVLENSVTREGRKGLSVLRSVCGTRETVERDAGAEGNCFHGAGHGIRRRWSLVEARDLCASIATNVGHLTSCLDGAAMEDAWQPERVITDLSDVPTACDGLDDDTTLACGVFLPDRLRSLNLDDAQVARACAKLRTAQAREGCTGLIGFNLLPGEARVCAEIDAPGTVEACLAAHFARSIYQARNMTTREAGATCRQQEDEAIGARCATALARTLLESRSRTVEAAGERCRSDLRRSALVAACMKELPIHDERRLKRDEPLPEFVERTSKEQAA